NPRYASYGQYLDIWANDNNYLDPNTGEVNYQQLLADDAQARLKARQKEISSLSRKDEEVKAKALRDTVEKLKSRSWWFDDSRDFIDKEGRTIVVERNPEGYYINNIVDFPSISEDDRAKYKKMSLDGVVDFL